LERALIRHFRVLLGVGLQAGGKVGAPSNILFIMCDQLRFDYLGCYGHPFLRTLRSGILIGYWDEAELAAARTQLGPG
jgi:hypothetical protein